MSRAMELARGVIIAGVSGTTFDGALPEFGGYVLFVQDDAIGDVRALTDALRAREDPPPLIAIDQEGGRVMRLRDGVEPIPPMMALGAADDADLTRRAAEQLAFDLRRAGCTLDFAPVLDLALDSNNVVIGTRSFGTDPQRVAHHGSIFALGLRNGGILPCYKHFPGHGATSIDSHEALPRIDSDRAALEARDLVPFARVAPSAPAMMSAHVLATALDPRHPATFSPAVLSRLLREELGFRGALITDCLEMKAAQGRGGRSGVEALAAGADLLLFSHDLEAATATARAIAEAAEAGYIPLERLEEAWARAMELRRAASTPLPLGTVAPHPMIGREAARRAVTLVRGVPHADAVASVVVSFGGTRALEREAPALRKLIAASDPSHDEIATLLEALATGGRRPVILARRAHLHPSQADAIAQIVRRFPDALVVSLCEPYDVTLFSDARHVIATYGDDDASIGGLADVIFGASMPTGRLPVALPA